MMARFTLQRRSVLRGMGGVALALPALEAMAPPRRAHAAAAELPRRYVVCYGGLSVGGYKAPWDYTVPKTTGPDYELTRGLAPIGQLQVKPYVGIVSGLTIPWQQSGGSVPPAGRIASFHGTTMVPQLSGTRSMDRSDRQGGATSDQIVADTFAAVGSMTVHRSLAFRVQPSSYENSGGTGNMGRLSWTRSGPIEPTVSPSAAYQSVFGGAATPGTQQQSLAAFLDRRKSILDFVRDNTQRLVVRLGADDRRRMQQHLDEVRALEDRIVALGKVGSTSCKRPDAPMADPPIGSSSVGGTNKLSASNAYSNEDLRAEIMCRFVALAFACDLTRVASVLFTLRQCYMNGYTLFGKLADLHGFSHYAGGIGDPGPLADAMAWHVKHFAKLAAQLRDTREVDGSSVLDHTAMVMAFEGGHGHDPESDATNKNYAAGVHSPHSTENMVVIMAGGAGGLKAGQHVRYNNDRHPAQVLYTAMNAVGARAPLGDISTPLPELFTVTR
jgi:hypothetical protein